ncbi:MAG: translation initiation factor IF-2 subunit gamma [Candidatus Aenigmarchaeota archaeon]|nr:translation initiation factor IF-2 subunit gamma [Candidatus Aenigmarchaeota archaeon]
MTRRNKSDELKDERVQRMFDSSVFAGQPELNVGMVGHVDHGKTTLVKTLSGKWTDTHSEEIKRGITIRLGYADVTIFKCGTCEGADAYSISSNCQKCKTASKQVLKLSLVDAPGHESLMATMLCGANIMDGALLLVAANEKCPQPQTDEHVTALQIMGIKNLVVLQNKIDLVSDEQAKKNYEEIRQFLKGTAFENAPIIPISAFNGINIDVLLQQIVEGFERPKRDPESKPVFYVARSFDVNKPGAAPKEMNGGVIGGTLKQGVLAVGDKIEILPGYEVEEKNQKVWKPLRTTIVSLVSGGVNAQAITPGGTAAIMTQLDPSIVKSDKLVGAIASHVGQLPQLWYSLKLEPTLLDRVVGAKDKLVVEPIKMGEILMLNVNSAATVGIVRELAKKTVVCTLKRPVCAETGSRVTISRSVGQRWRLIGYGTIKS